jgi:hypothetical protein
MCASEGRAAIRFGLSRSAKESDKLELRQYGYYLEITLSSALRFIYTTIKSSVLVL